MTGRNLDTRTGCYDSFGFGSTTFQTVHDLIIEHDESTDDDDDTSYRATTGFATEGQPGAIRSEPQVTHTVLPEVLGPQEVAAPLINAACLLSLFACSIGE